MIPSLIATGHSVSHLRQWLLFKKIGELELAEVLVLGPTRWYDEQAVAVAGKNFSLVALEPIGNTFHAFRLRGLERYFIDFSPTKIFIVEEPYTFFAQGCMKMANRLDIPFAVFSWENKLDRRYGAPFDRIEEEVIQAADILIAGNEGAKRRLIVRGVKEEKIAVCPMTGIACDVFKPIADIEKSYDLVYHGRFVREKGVYFIQDVAEELRLKIRWIGGRSNDFVPSYGDYAGWIAYENLPRYLNRAKIGVQFPYSYNYYQEQYNFGVAELMSVELPVICSDNGSLREVYGDSPAIMVHEGDVDALKREIQRLLRDEELRGELGRKGRAWVEANLSLEVIGKKLVKILERCF